MCVVFFFQIIIGFVEFGLALMIDHKHTIMTDLKYYVFQDRLLLFLYVIDNLSVWSLALLKFVVVAIFLLDISTHMDSIYNNTG